jgi:hypothetical protein
MALSRWAIGSMLFRSPSSRSLRRYVVYPELPLDATDSRRDVGYVRFEVPIQFFQVACLLYAKPDDKIDLAQDQLT